MPPKKKPAAAPRTRRTFSQQFKFDTASQAIKARNVDATAKAAGVGPGTLSVWIKLVRTGKLVNPSAPVPVREDDAPRGRPNGDSSASGAPFDYGDQLVGALRSGRESSRALPGTALATRDSTETIRAMQATIDQQDATITRLADEVEDLKRVLRVALKL